MFYAFGDQRAREIAYWYPINREFKTFSPISVENINETRKSYINVSENMYGSGVSLTLRTRYLLDYLPPQDDKIQHIKYRDKWYEISAVRPVELGSFGIYRPKEFYLDLIEVAYGPDYASTD